MGILNPSTACSISYNISSSFDCILFSSLIFFSQEPKLIEEKSALFKLLLKVEIKWEEFPSFINMVSLLFTT